MAHQNETVEKLDTSATTAQIVDKINELIELINHMWRPNAND